MDTATLQQIANTRYDLARAWGTDRTAWVEARDACKAAGWKELAADCQKQIDYIDEARELVKNESSD